MSIAEYPCFKLVIVGNGRTGKTSLLKRHLTGEFKRQAEVYHLDFFTNRGKIIFECWDTAGRGLCDRLSCLGGECAIIMFDVTDKLTYKNVPTLQNDVYSACERIPVVLCGNKVDMMHREVTRMDVNYLRKRDVEYYDVSSKTNFNIEKPFLYLARKLFRLEEEVADAANKPLRDSEDDMVPLRACY